MEGEGGAGSQPAGALFAIALLITRDETRYVKNMMNGRWVRQMPFFGDDAAWIVIIP
jgi:hypothetical protein